MGAAKLWVNLLTWNAAAKGGQMMAPVRIDVGQGGAARLAEGDEHLERLAPVVLRDGDVHRAERRVHPPGRALEQLGTRALGATRQVLRLHLVQLVARARQLRVELGDALRRLGPGPLPARRGLLLLHL